MDQSNHGLPTVRKVHAAPRVQHARSNVIYPTGHAVVVNSNIIAGRAILRVHRCAVLDRLLNGAGSHPSQFSLTRWNTVYSVTFEAAYFEHNTRGHVSALYIIHTNKASKAARNHEAIFSDQVLPREGRLSPSLMPKPELGANMI